MNSTYQNSYGSQSGSAGTCKQRTRHTALVAALAAWIGLCTGVTGQETVTLQSPDGQVIKGEVIKRENGVITLKSEIFGQIEVSESKVKEVKGAVASGASPSPSQHAGTVVPSPAPKVEQTDATSHPAKDKTRALLHMPSNMTIHAGAGLGYLEGHQTQAENYSASLQLNYDTKRYKNQVLGSYQYGKANGQLTSDNYSASARTYRYFGKSDLTPYFAKFKLMHSADEVQLVDNQSEVLIGLGRDIHKSDRFSMRMSVGYASEWEDFSSNPAFGFADPGVEHRNKAFLHEEIDLNLTSKFSLHHEGYFMMEHEDEYEVRLTNGFKYKLTNHLSLDLNHSFIFDDTSPIGVDEDTTQINLQLGYSL